MAIDNVTCEEDPDEAVVPQLVVVLLDEQWVQVLYDEFFILLLKLILFVRWRTLG
jgi:hypothetical protein